MPRYAYECQSCEATWSAVESIHADPARSCSACGSDTAFRVIGNPNVIVRGKEFRFDKKIPVIPGLNDRGGQSAAVMQRQHQRAHEAAATKAMRSKRARGLSRRKDGEGRFLGRLDMREAAAYHHNTGIPPTGENMEQILKDTGRWVGDVT